MSKVLDIFSKSQNKLSKRDANGFTLMEILVSVAVIAILAFVLLPAIVGGIKTSGKSIRSSEATARLQALVEEIRGEPTCAALSAIAGSQRTAELSNGSTLRLSTSILNTCQDRASVNLRILGTIDAEEVIRHELTVYVSGDGALVVNPYPEPPVSTSVPYVVHLRCPAAVSGFLINATWTGASGKLVWSDGVTYTGAVSGSARNLAANTDYQVAVTGDIAALSMVNGADCYRKVSVWGSMRPLTLAAAFQGAVNLTTVPNVNFTSKVTNISSMFRGATNFNALLDKWDTSNVGNMSGTFYQATSFNNGAGAGVGSGNFPWNTSKVTDMANMFHEASSFNGRLSNLDTSNVTKMSGMFSGATAFNNGGGSSPLTFDTSKVTEMAAMFTNAASFNQRLGASSTVGWDTSKVTRMDGMFSGATAFNNGTGTRLLIDTSNVTDMSGMFRNAISFNRDLGASGAPWNTAKVTSMHEMFRGATSFDKALNWDTSKVIYMNGMFRGATSFNKVLSWNVSSVQLFNEMFFGAYAFNNGQSPGQATASMLWNTSSATTMERMFSSARSFNQPVPSSSWNTSKVTTMREMFFKAEMFNKSLASFNTSSLIDWTSYRRDSAISSSSNTNWLRVNGTPV